MKFFLLLLFFGVNLVNSQSNLLITQSIPDNLKNNSNAVVREIEHQIVINSQSAMTIKERRVITILNEQGNTVAGTYEYFDKRRKIKKIEAKIYNKHGKEIKSVKRKDFKDVSVGDGFSIFNDNRMLDYDYIPVDYPYTLVYESEIETSNTAFIPSWNPIPEYFVSVEKSTYSVTCPKELGFYQKEMNFSEKYNIQKNEEGNRITYTITNQPSLKYEENSPDYLNFIPNVFSRVEKFNLEGENGTAKTWEEFGKWYYDVLLAGTDEISSGTMSKITQLVSGITDPIEKAKIIYKYVQDNTRYVSIQVGIGGFKPMLAKDVDRLGYGDCKALTNYTRTLLKNVGVESYYTIVYAGNNRRSLLQDFPSVQGNHIILAIPDNNEIIWLECTSQTQPFGFAGSFTDHRNVLMVKPDGGQIIRTTSYLNEQNSQKYIGNCKLDHEGNIQGNVSIISKGKMYDENFHVQKFSQEKINKHYKTIFRNINNLKIANYKHKDNPENIEFVENIEITATKYANVSGNQMIFVVNVFNPVFYSPKKYRNRENPFIIDRGYINEDEYEIMLPEGYKTDAIPGIVKYDSKFGSYEMEIKLLDQNKIVYKRKITINDGQFNSFEYDEYRLFREQIARHENSKIVLTKI